jgi:predicted ArsR family transcriptional regulator
MVEDDDYSEQAQLFAVLSSELRLRLLSQMTEGRVTAPELAEQEGFEVTSETIHNNLKQLRDAGLVDSERIYGPGNRPKDAFSLADEGIELALRVSDRYSFDLDFFE